MKRITTIITLLMLVCMGANAYSTVSVTSAQDSKGNALVSGAFYRILLPLRGASVALQQNDEYVKANNGLGIIGFMWKVESDADGKALISNPAGGYWKFTDYNAGNSKVKTNGTADDRTAFQMAWYSSGNQLLNLFDPAGGSYAYDGVTCGAVLSNHGGVGNNMGIYNDILDGGSIFKFERFYRTIFTVESTDVNGVAVENYPATVTINGDVTASEYYTNSDNQITSFSTVYGAAYYIDGVEKTAEEVKDAINANTSTLTVTVKPRPFVASTNESPAYYAIMISGNANSWWENTNGTVVNCAKDRSIPDVTARSAWIWEMKQNGTDGYRIYNVSAEKYLGGRTETGGVLALGDAASANSFKSYYNNATTVKFKDYTNNLWIDRNTVNSVAQPYAHTSGQQLTFLRMYKVTFSEAITVNSVDDVTTIYVKGDGSDALTLPSDKLFSINGADPVGYADAATAIAACSSDLTVTVSNNTTKDVTYILKWSDGTTINAGVSVTTELLTPSSDHVPSAFVSPFTTLSYSAEEITNETNEITVTATWNGPFQISSNYASAIWQVVQMHTYINGSSNYPAEKWSWSYKSDDSDKVKPEQVLEYDAVTTNRLFCFVGNPYDGFKIYNAAKGDGYTLTRAGESDELTMASGDHLFTLHASRTDNDISTYFCLKPSGATNYLNFDYSNKKIAGWNDADNGSTCWVVAPGQYYLDFIDGLYLDAPVGAVGTRAYFQTIANAETIKGNIRGYRTTVASNMYSNELGNLNTYLNPIRDTETISLGNGYYRIVSAKFAEERSLVFDQSLESPSGHDISTAVASKIVWSKTNKKCAGNIFYLNGSGTTFSIKNCNKNEYLSSYNGTTSETSTNTTFNLLSGSLQYNLVVNDEKLHAQGWNWTGTLGSEVGNLVGYDGGIDSPSAWYIVKATDMEIALNGPVDNKYYATFCVPFDVTISGADAFTLKRDGSNLEPTQLTDNKVPAGTAVLLQGTTTAATATINTGTAFTTDNTNSLLGAYVQKDFALTNDATAEYFLGVDDNNKVGFYHSGVVSKEGYYTLAANRAYLANGGSSARGYAINWSDASSVQDTKAAEDVNSAVVYDLQGRRVENPQHGMYIRNGRVIVVK